MFSKNFESRIMKKKLFLLLLVSPIMFWACSDDDEKTPEIESVQITNKITSIKVGESHQFEFTYSPSNAAKPSQVSWSSSNVDIAKFEKSGYLTAQKDGTITILLEVQSDMLSSKVFRDQIELSVLPIEAEGIKFSSESLELTRESTHTLTVSFIPSNAKEKEIEWSSSDEKIVTVSNGQITALKIGEAVITAKIKNTDIKATCKVKVSAIVLSGIKFKEENIELSIGDSKNTEITFEPENADNKKITYTSAAPEIATVDENGIIKAIAKGETTITATTEDGKLKALCQVKVNDIYLTGIEFEVNYAYLRVGESASTKLIFYPENATNKKVTYKSLNPGIATVNEKGVIKGIAKGETTIIATSEEGGKTTPCSVYVEDIPLGSVRFINPMGIMEPGGKQQTKVELLPANASNKNIRYVSSNPSVATVDNNGLITAITKGSSNISVISENNEYVQDVINLAVVDFNSFIYLEKVSSNMTDLGGYKTGTITYRISNKSLSTTITLDKILGMGKYKDGNYVYFIDEENLSNQIKPGESITRTTTIDTLYDPFIRVDYYGLGLKFDVYLHSFDF